MFAVFSRLFGRRWRVRVARSVRRRGRRELHERPRCRRHLRGASTVRRRRRPLKRAKTADGQRRDDSVLSRRNAANDAAGVDVVERSVDDGASQCGRGVVVDRGDDARCRRARICRRMRERTRRAKQQACARAREEKRLKPEWNCDSQTKEARASSHCCLFFTVVCRTARRRRAVACLRAARATRRRPSTGARRPCQSQT